MRKPIRTLDPTWTVVTPIEGPCPTCLGDGSIETDHGMYFDEHEEAWYPRFELEPCPTCRATGLVTTFQAAPSNCNAPNPTSHGLKPVDEKELPF